MKKKILIVGSNYYNNIYFVFDYYPKGDFAKFLDDVYQKPDSYSYLELEFDSKMRDFENKVRIYKINYEEFDKMN